MAEEKPKSNSMVLFQFFGLRDGQTRADFIAELRDLTDDDKAQLADGIRDETYDY